MEPRNRPQQRPQRPPLGQWPRRGARYALAVTGLCLTLGVAYAKDAPNVLEARSKVAEMADESIEMLKSQVALQGVEGWAVFSGDRVAPDLDPGVGLAERLDGETHYMRQGTPLCVPPHYREVLVFRDEDTYREFRQGELQGKALERLRSDSPDSRVTAFKFKPTVPPKLEPVDLSSCRFALHKDLQRALVGEPSQTKGMVDENEVDVDDN